MARVLVVDDDLELLEMVTLVLSTFDFKVDTLSDCEDFFSALSLVQPDIILMDIYLGACDGRDLCRRLKTSEERRPLPVLLYSAGTITPESVTESYADEFIAKPFDIDVLHNRIKSLLNQGQA